MKTALVIGGTGTIGGAIVQALVKKDYKVFLNYRNPDKIKKLSNSPLVHVFHADFSQHNIQTGFESVERIFDSIDKLDLFVYAAGVTLSKLFPITKREERQLVYHINFDVPIDLTGIVLKKMSSQKPRSGHIVFISSAAAHFITRGQTAYISSKKALEWAMHGIAKDYFNAKGLYKGIRLNAVAPGFVDGEMTANLNKELIIKNIHTHRFVKPEEVADAVLFLDCNESMHNQVLVIDGGLGLE